MSTFRELPTVPVLHTFAKISLIDGFTTIDRATFRNINKAVRLWYTLTQFGSEFKQDEFTSRQWRKYIDPSGYDDKSEKLSLDPGSIATKEIKEILSYQQNEWDEWKLSFIEFYSGVNGQGKSKVELSKYLVLLEKEKPFKVTGAAIFGDITELEEKGYLRLVSDPTIKGESRSKFRLTDKPFSLLSNLYISNPEQPEKTVKLKPENSASLTDDFSSYGYLFFKPFGIDPSDPDDLGFQRFYIHSDYRISDKDLKRTIQHQTLLAGIWDKPIISLVKLKYQSASEGKPYEAIISPVRIDYHQRAFYLCGFGIRDSETELSWHNYRIDRIEEIEELENSRDDLPQDLQVQGERANQQKLIEEIEDRLVDAYGFDFYRDKQTMLLRFDRDFHDRYIANTWRHNSFKQITPSKEEIYPLIEGSNPANSKLLKKRIAAHPNDAYYRMNYRDGDNSVIMRLRAWCPNVEVLFPYDLRDRMREDIQNTWNLYRDDE